MKLRHVSSETYIMHRPLFSVDDEHMNLVFVKMHQIKIKKELIEYCMSEIDELLGNSAGIVTVQDLEDGVELYDNCEEQDPAFMKVNQIVEWYNIVKYNLE